MVTSTKRGKQQSSHLLWDMLTSWVHGERAARPPGDTRSGLWRWRELWIKRGDAPSSLTAEAPMSTSNTVGTEGERVQESSPQASVRWLPFVLSRSVLHLVERKNGSLAEPRIAASGAANGKRGALGGGFRYRHGTQSAVPSPARHCPIGLERRGILFVKAAPDGITTPAPRATPSPMRHGHTGILCKLFAENVDTGGRHWRLAGSIAAGLLAFSSHHRALVLVMDVVQWRFVVRGLVYKGEGVASSAWMLLTISWSLYLPTVSQETNSFLNSFLPTSPLLF